MSDHLRGIAAVMGAIVIWGVTFTLTKLALRWFAPAETAFLRQLFALPVLLALARREGGLDVSVRLIVPLSATGMVGFFLFTNLGLERASASTGALVQGSAPVMTALLAAGVLRERLGPRVVAGIALAVSGAALLAWGVLRVESLLGLAFLFLGAMSWSVYTVLGRHLGGRITAAGATAVPGLLAATVFAFGPLFEDWAGARASVWLLVACVGFFGSGVAYMLWNYGIARVEAARAGVYSNLVPVVSVLVAWLALGESVGGREAVGGAVVIAGAVLASSRGALRLGRQARPRAASARPVAPGSAPEA